MTTKAVAQAIADLTYAEMMDMAEDIFGMLADEGVWPDFPKDREQIASLLFAWAEVQPEDDDQ